MAIDIGEDFETVRTTERFHTLSALDRSEAYAAQLHAHGLTARQAELFAVDAFDHPDVHKSLPIATENRTGVCLLVEVVERG
jgi:hypothetical protein